MNMKKTIAAIAAGAVAVSAMATTVSALNDASLSYNLVKEQKVKKYDDHATTYMFTANNVAVGAKTLEFYSPVDTVKSVQIKVASATVGEQNKSFTYSTNNEALNFNANLSQKDANGNLLKVCTLTFTNEFDGYTGPLTLEVTVNGTIAGTDANHDEIKEINGILGKDNTVLNGTVVAASIDGAGADVTPVTLKAFTKGGEKEAVYYVPFKTAITGNENITRYLEVVKGYHNVGAVLNDAIENYESVTFTFNTATNPIAYGVKAGTYTVPASQYTNWADEVRTFAVDCEKVYSANDKWWGDGTYAMALDAVGGDTSRLIGIYAGEAWAGDDTFTKFDQHLYQGTAHPYGTYTTSYASENTGYLGFDWTGYNLFQGALVINENLTMSLAETDYFDWTATSLSFDWDAIMDGAMTSNDYAVYLHSMKLATSNTWYWDNMVVTLTAGAAEDGVDAEAGVEADDEELAEEEVEEEVVEEEVEEEVEVEVANPTTGNASVALAVIPVALAAAAVVAKKRS